MQAAETKNTVHYVGTVALAGPDEGWTASYMSNRNYIVFKFDSGTQFNIIPENYSSEAIATSGTCTLVLEVDVNLYLFWQLTQVR
jgi:hypothetical protein